MLLRIRQFLAAVVLAVTSPAGAVLIELDLIDPAGSLVPGDVTRDPASGLDWADPVVTSNAYGVDLSFDELEAGAGGWAADGWRHATTSEVCGLLAALMVAPLPCPGVFEPESPAVLTAGQLVGFTGGLSGTGVGGLFLVAFFDDDDGNTDLSGVLRMVHNCPRT